MRNINLGFTLGKSFLFVILGLLSFPLFSQINNKSNGNKIPAVESLWNRGGRFEGFTAGQEVIEKRLRNAKHFKNANGSFTVQTGGIYHYKDENDLWQDIDLTLHPSNRISGYAFANEANDIKSYFPVEAGSRPVLMKLSANSNFSWWQSPTLSFTLEGSVLNNVLPKAIKGIVKENSLTYPNVYNGISEEFVTLQNGIENNTIIHSLTPEMGGLPTNANIEFSQFIPLKGDWKIDVNGETKLSDFNASEFHINIPGTENGIFFSPVTVFDNILTREEAIFILNSPLEKLTEDQQQKKSHIYQSDYRIQYIKGGIQVTTILPASWVKAENRSFPVTIDPTVTVTPPSSAGNFYGPLANWYGYARHADLYLSSELGISSGNNITDIEYNRTNTTGTNAVRPIKIFMRTTTANSLTGLTDAWNSNTYTGGLTALFDASIDLHGTTTGWKMITLTTPFLYNNDNLIVMAYDAYGGSGSAKYFNQGTTSVTARQAFKRQDNTDPGDGSAMGVEDRLTEIRITYSAAGPPCTTPTAQPSALILNPTGATSISGSFTAASPVPDGYLVVRTNTNVAPSPVTGTSYSVGTTTAIGYIVSSGTSLSFNSTSLSPSTTYYYWGFSYNVNSCSGGPVYLTTSPLSGSASTTACGGIAGGTYTVGPTGNYATLTAAINATTSGMTGPVIFELQPAYSSGSETYPITFPFNACATAGSPLTVRPATGATALQIASSNAVATIDLNGAKYVTIDGRPGGTGTTSQLFIDNQLSTGVAVRLINDAQNNTITYCDIQGQNTTSPTTGTASNAGIVYISTASSTGLQGNDNNTISNSSIHSNGGGFAAVGIFAIGTSSSVGSYNDNCTISNCKIYDVFNATLASTAIKVDAGNNAWTISNNSIYQSSTYTYTGAVTHRGIWVTPNTASINNTASGFIITGNFIGGTDFNTGGTAYTMTATVAALFNGMDISVGLGTATSVQNNTITNISHTVTSTSTTAFVGISIANGNVDCGTVTGNTIGSNSTNGAIAFTTASNLGGVMGIRTGGGGTINISNNKIGGIDLNGATASIATSFTGINAGGGTTVNVTNNTVGSTETINSINNVTASTSTSAGVINGINVSAGTNATVTGNTIANLNTNYMATGTQAGCVRGILISSSTPAVTSISNNVIKNLSTSSQTTGSGANCAIVGISMTSTNVAGCSVIGNTIDSLVLNSVSASAAVQATGIFYSGITTVNNSISRNFIHTFDAANANPNILLTAIDNAGGSNTLANNMIRLGIKPDGTDISNDNVIRGISSNVSGTTYTTGIYFNSIYIGGANVGSTVKNTYAIIRTATAGTYNIRNNILINTRSNSSAGSGGKHYVLYFTTATTGVTSNYNIYQYTGTDGYFAYNGTADVAAYATGWLSGDNNSIVGNPQLINPTGALGAVNLHIHATNPTPIEAAGIDIPSITTDFDDQTRGGLTPVDIGADAGNFALLDISAPSLVYTPLSTACNTSDRTLTVTITDGSGVATGGLAPRIYYKKASGSTWYSRAATLSSGTVTNGVWSFTIIGADMGGVNNLDVIEYYLIAQDIAGNIASNPGGAVATNVNTISTPPTTPASYVIATLNGTYLVGSSQPAPFNTLTSAVNTYNNACLTGPVTLSLVDPTYNIGSGEIFPIIINANATASAVNTLTIRPSSGNAVSISETSGTSPAALIKLNGADYVTLDGNYSGGSILIENTSVSAGSTCIWIASAGAGQGATNNTIRGVSIKGGAPQNTGTVVTYGIIIAGSTLATTAASVTAGDDNDNNTIDSCMFSKVRYAVYTRGGATTNPNLGTIITRNIIGSGSFGADEVGKVGILVREEDGIQITRNDIGYVGGDYSNISGGSDRVAIALTTDGAWTAPTAVYVKNAVITNNLIHDIVDERTFSAIGIVVAAADGTNATNNIIANNMIYNLRSNGTGSDQAVGIALSASKGDKVVYNSIYMAGDTDPNASASTPTISSHGIVIGAATVTDVNILNNIVYMDLTSSSATTLKYSCINVPTSYTWGTGSLNYNDWYISGSNTQTNIGSIGTTFYNTLATWQAASGKDANSRDFDPGFASPTDLHISTSSAIDNLGTPVAGVTTDFDLQTRSLSTPDIGADEVAAPACTGAVGGTASAVTSTICASGSTNINATGYSIGTGGTYQWQYSTDNSNWNDMVGQTIPNNVNTGTIIVTTYYRLKVTCPAGTSLAYSSPVVTVTVYPNPTVSVNPAGPITICQPATQNLSITATSASSPGYQWRTGGVDISGANSNNYTAITSGNYTVKVTDGITNCFVVSSAVSVTINAQPPAVTVTPSSNLLCSPNSPAALLTASPATLPTVILSEDFSSTTAGSTTTGYLPAGWTGSSLTSGVRLWGVVASAQTGSTLGGGNFLYCESDLYTTFQTRSEVITPAFDASAYTAINIKFKQYYNDLTSGASTDSARVYISNDGGANWTLVQQYDADQGTAFSSAGSVNATIAVPGSVTLTNNMMVRLLYNSDAGGNDWYWAVDDFVIDGTPMAISYTWSPLTGLYTDANATTAYIGGVTTTVYAKPSSTTSYTATSSSAAGCTNTGSATITYNSNVTNSTTLAATSGGPQVCANYSVSTSNNYFSNCNIIATIAPSGGSAVSGNINTCVKIDATVQTAPGGEAYVQRHFNITPASNPGTATSTITLYFLQSEFTAFNAANGTYPDLPTNGSDATGKANLRITQYNGIGTAPGNYTGSAVQINPADASIVYNSTAGRWEVTFDATGSGGFYVHTGNFVLPVTLVNFKGERIGAINKLSWQTETEANNSGFELQRSADGINFSKLSFVATKADNGYSNTTLSYSYNDENPLRGNNYYRLKQVDKDGKYSYSTVVLLRSKATEITLSSVYPNPAQNELNLVITSPSSEKVTIVVTDLSGKVIMQQTAQLLIGDNQQQLKVQSLASGTYIIKAVCSSGCETAVHRFVKQ
jgi:hypothetical protein